ncbi:MAG: hypothetical protein EZS28_025914 [Streblomastix strix]|uniref:Uncharacterized protein n=1 Tax=Streblomastix strix TaxID=222440 RepID=A0A5J4V6Y2_9EUKA|nr:MAG: hypothetical protein EZS28_025914 [Streblomastix strix]
MNKLHFVEGDTDSAYWVISSKAVRLYENSGKQVILNSTNQQEYTLRVKAQSAYESNLHQGFKYVIRDQQFYDANAKYFLPTIMGDKQDETDGLSSAKHQPSCIADEKKLLGLSIENEGDEMIAFAPKNYYINIFKRNQLTDVIKLKGINLRQKNISKQDVIDNVISGNITQGTNM